MKKSDLKEYIKPVITNYGKLEQITKAKNHLQGDGASKNGSSIV